MARIGAFRPGLVALALAGVMLGGEPPAPDHHITADPAQRLFRASPFAHGYIHGYEIGFGLGDEDVQIGRGAQAIRKTVEYKDGDGGYRPAFGSRESFRAGFREGLSIGYRDAFSGGEFRALNELRRLASGVEGELLADAADRIYDGGFLVGYRAARQEAPDECRTSTAAGRERFCSGFLDGFELGESDTGAATTARDRGTAPPLLPRPAGRSYPRR